MSSGAWSSECMAMAKHVLKHGRLLHVLADLVDMDIGQKVKPNIFIVRLKILKRRFGVNCR